MISWILTKVAIGEYLDAVNEEALKQNEIDCILSLRGGEAEDSSIEEENICFNLGITFFRVPIFDRGYWCKHDNNEEQVNVKLQLKTAAYMLDLLADRFKRILVHCTGGIDRAPFVVALHMSKMELEYQDDYVLSRTDLAFWVDKAYKFIKEKRPQIIRHMEWV